MSSQKKKKPKVRRRVSAGIIPNHVDPTLPPEGYVGNKTVLAHFNIGNTTLWRLIKAGKFPAPVALSSRRVNWDVVDLRAHKEKLRHGAA